MTRQLVNVEIFTGRQGQPGEDGEDGSKILTGFSAPTTDVGENDDLFIDFSLYDVYSKQDDVWALQGNIKGPPGQPATSGLPVGGTIGQILAKQSSTDFDATWVNNTSLPAGTLEGQIQLRNSDGSNFTANANFLLSDTAGDLTLDFVDATSVTISNNDSGFAGLLYPSDLSANFTDRSLVDKAYVDAQAGGGGGAFTASLNTDISPTAAIILSQASGDEVAFNTDFEVNKAADNYIGHRISITETATAGTDNKILSYSVGGSEVFRIGADGNLGLASGGGTRVLGTNGTNMWWTRLGVPGSARFVVGEGGGLTTEPTAYVGLRWDASSNAGRIETQNSAGLSSPFLYDNTNILSLGASQNLIINADATTLAQVIGLNDISFLDDSGTYSMFNIERNKPTFAGVLTEIATFRSGVAGTEAVKVIGPGAANAATFLVGNGGNKKVGLLAGTGGSAFEYDVTGAFSVVSNTNADVGSGIGGTLGFQINATDAVFYADNGTSPILTIERDTDRVFIESSSTVNTLSIGTTSHGLEVSTSGTRELAVKGPAPNITLNDTSIIMSLGAVSGGNLTYTTGDGSHLGFLSNYVPTSGTGTFNVVKIDPTINQTGGASGITRGIYINPTLTAAADWRAIDATGDFYFRGAMRIADVTAPTADTTGLHWLYVDSADNNLKFRDEAGTVFDLTSGGGATPTLQQVLDAGSIGTASSAVTLGVNNTLSNQDLLISNNSSASQILITNTGTSGEIILGSTAASNSNVYIDQSEGDIRWRVATSNKFSYDFSNDINTSHVTLRAISIETTTDGFGSVGSSSRTYAEMWALQHRGERVNLDTTLTDVGINEFEGYNTIRADVGAQTGSNGYNHINFRVDTTGRTSTGDLILLMAQRDNERNFRLYEDGSIRVTDTTTPTSDATGFHWLYVDSSDNDLKFRDEDGETSQMVRVAKITLSPAQIQSLNTTPVTAISSQGSGKIVSVINAVAYLDYNSAAYVASGGSSSILKLQVSGGAAQVRSTQSGFITNGSDQTDSFITVSFAQQPASTGWELTADNDFTTGDSNIIVFIQYIVLDTN